VFDLKDEIVIFFWAIIPAFHISQTKVVYNRNTYLTINTHNESVSNKFITHIKPSTGIGSMGP
jgi:hypothetical protein